MLTLTDEQLSIFEFAHGLGMKLTAPTAAAVTRTLEDLSDARGSAIVIGGLAVIRYGYVRLTTQFDLLYDSADEKMDVQLGGRFRQDNDSSFGWRRFIHRETGTRLQLVPSGSLSQHGLIPRPDEVGDDDGFVTLSGLVWLKLVAGRAKDEADIVELWKVQQTEIESLRNRLPEQYHARYDKLLQQAKREYDNDPHRLR